MITSAPFSVTVVGEQACPAYDFLVTTSAARVFDGGTEGVGPGQVIQLQAGTHGPRTFQNLAGTAALPIVIRTDPAGPAIIRRGTPDNGDFVLCFRNCQHVIVDGSCSGEPYGIKVMYSVGGDNQGDRPTAYLMLTNNQIGLDAGTPTSFMTFRRVAIEGGYHGGDGLGGGIGVHLADHQYFRRATHPTKRHESFVFDHVRVFNVPHSGFYLGPNYNDGDISCKDVTLRYCHAETCGQDGIKVKSWFEGTNAIHHNVVRDVGMDPLPATGFHYGITAQGSKVDIYNNWVQDTGEPGIQLYNYNGPLKSEGFGPFHCRIYNNLVIRAGTWWRAGLLDPDSFVVGSSAIDVEVFVASIFNNTSISPKGMHGIDFNAHQTAGGLAKNNLLIDGGVSAPGGITVSNNPTSASFVDAAGDDFRLASATPPASGTPGEDIAPTDYADTPRPPGSEDCGAYEHTG